MILHVDMDAFYASVEERDRPELQGKPVIVGGSPEGRGVVAAANYVVRNFGVRSAMATARALALCPDAIVLRPRMGHYSAISHHIHEIFHRYTPLVEPLSLDEAFLDATESVLLFGPVESIGRSIKKDIWDELRLVASVGVAPNKFLAKLASDLDKPDGFTVITPDAVQSVLGPLPVTRIWGVGKATEQKFDGLGIQTIGQLRQVAAGTAKSSPLETEVNTSGDWLRGSMTASSLLTAKQNQFRTKPHLQQISQISMCCEHGYWTSRSRSLIAYVETTSMGGR